MTEKQGDPNLYQILIQSRGQNWDEEKPYQEQDGIKSHIEFYAPLLESGKLVFDGLFLDNSGGLTIFDEEDVDEALETGLSDPAVKSEIIKVKAKSWLSPFNLKRSLPDFQLENLQIMHAIFFHPGENWEPGVPFEQQEGIMDHVRYYSLVYKNKKVLMGGPFLDGTGALIILLASHPLEAQTIVKNDPGVKNKILVPEIKPWVTPIKAF